MEINYLISERRKALHLTLEDIARHVGVSKSTVKKWESGYIKNMKRDKMALLAEILEISPIDLLGVNVSSFSKFYDASSTQEIIYTPDEVAHLQKYRALDDNGRAAVDSVLNTLYGQRSDKIEDSSDETTAS